MEYRPPYNDSLRADILPSYSDSLAHHGVKGQKWGVRRYQNRDGTYTPAGKHRHDNVSKSSKSKKGKMSMAKKIAIGAGLAAGAYAGASYGLYRKDEMPSLQKRALDKYKDDLADFNKKDRNRIARKIASNDLNNGFKYDFQKIAQKAKNKGFHAKHRILSKISPNKDKRTAHNLADQWLDAEPIKFKNKNDINIHGASVFDKNPNALKYIEKQKKKLKHFDIQPSYKDSLMHHGIKGMHWGVRRFEDSSGHLTPAGKKRYDKYDYSDSSSSKTSSTKKSTKRGMSVKQKAALAGAAALTAYGAYSYAKNKRELGDIRKSIESKHASELEGLDSKKRDKILNKVSREQKYERERLKKKANKNKRNGGDTPIDTRATSDDYISSRINKMWPKNKKAKSSKSQEPKKSLVSQSKKNEQQTRLSNKPYKKTSTTPSSETIAIKNANRMASIDRARGIGSYSKQQPKTVVKRTEQKTDTSKKTSKEKQKKQKKPMSIDTKIKLGKGILDTYSAVKKRDYAKVIYKGNQAVIDWTGTLIQRHRDQKL